MYVESLRRLSGSAIGSRCGVLDINAGADLEGVAVVTGANLVSRSFVNSNKSNVRYASRLSDEIAHQPLKRPSHVTYRQRNRTKDH